MEPLWLFHGYSIVHFMVHIVDNFVNDLVHVSSMDIHRHYLALRYLWGFDGDEFP